MNRTAICSTLLLSAALLAPPDAMGALTIDDLLGRSGKATARQPADGRASREAGQDGRARRLPAGQTGEDAAADTYTGPPRWAGEKKTAYHLAQSLLAGERAGVRQGALRKDVRAEFAEHLLKEERPVARKLEGARASERVSASTLECWYDKSGGAPHNTTIRFWPAGKRAALSPAIVQGYQREPDNFLDMEVGACPPTLAAALELGYGDSFFALVEQQRQSENDMTPQCEAEMRAEQGRAGLTATERNNLAYYQGFNLDKLNRDSVASAVARAHLTEGGANGGASGLAADTTAVSACILRITADESKFKFPRVYAQEGYAMRLLSGRGVKVDRAEAIRYLELAARSDYGSASMRLARLYLADASDPANFDKAVGWLRHAASHLDDTPAGSPVSPVEAPPVLFDIYLSGKQREKDHEAAEALYRALMKSRYFDGLLATTLPKIPGLREKLIAEEEARKVAAEVARRAATERSSKTCRTYRRTFGTQVSQVTECY